MAVLNVVTDECCRNNNQCWLTTRQIAERAGVGTATTARTIRSAEEMGFLRPTNSPDVPISVQKRWVNHARRQLEFLLKWEREHPR